MVSRKVFAMCCLCLSFILNPLSITSAGLGDCNGTETNKSDKKCGNKSFCVESVGECESIAEVTIGGVTYRGMSASSRMQTGTCDEQTWYWQSCDQCSGTVTCAIVTYYTSATQNPDGSYSCGGMQANGSRGRGNCS